MFFSPLFHYILSEGTLDIALDKAAKKSLRIFRKLCSRCPRKCRDYDGKYYHRKGLLNCSEDDGILKWWQSSGST